MLPGSHTDVCTAMICAYCDHFAAGTSAGVVAVCMVSGFTRCRGLYGVGVYTVEAMGFTRWFTLRQAPSPRPRPFPRNEVRHTLPICRGVWETRRDSEGGLRPPWTPLPPSLSESLRTPPRRLGVCLSACITATWKVPRGRKQGPSGPGPHAESDVLASSRRRTGHGRNKKSR